jgi:hypothetical protein
MEIEVNARPSARWLLQGQGFLTRKPQYFDRLSTSFTNCAKISGKFATFARFV